MAVKQAVPPPKKWLLDGEKPSLGAVLTNLIDQYEAKFSKCHKSYSLKCVHDLRVASRRLVVVLRELRAAEVKLKSKKLTRRMRKILKCLAPLRDLQVQKKLVREYGPRLYDSLGAEEARLKKKSLKKLLKQEAKLVRTLAKMRTRLSEVRSGLAAYEAPVVARLRLLLASELLDLHSGAVKIDTDDAQRVHKFRLAVKSFRYRRELVSALAEGCMEPLAQEVEDLQKVTGEIHDIDLLLESNGRKKLREKEPALYDFLISARGALARDLHGRLFQFTRAAQSEMLH